MLRGIVTTSLASRNLRDTNQLIGGIDYSSAIDDPRGRLLTRRPPARTALWSGPGPGPNGWHSAFQRTELPHPEQAQHDEAS